MSITLWSDCLIVKYQDIEQTCNNSVLVFCVPSLNMLNPWDKLYKDHKSGYIKFLFQIKINKEAKKTQPLKQLSTSQKIYKLSISVF